MPNTTPTFACVCVLCLPYDNALILHYSTLYSRILDIAKSSHFMELPQPIACKALIAAYCHAVVPSSSFSFIAAWCLRHLNSDKDRSGVSVFMLVIKTCQNHKPLWWLSSFEFLFRPGFRALLKNSAPIVTWQCDNVKMLIFINFQYQMVLYDALRVPSRHQQKTMPNGASFNPDARATIGKSPQNLGCMYCTPFGHATVHYWLETFDLATSH